MAQRATLAARVLELANAALEALEALEAIENEAHGPAGIIPVFEDDELTLYHAQRAVCAMRHNAERVLAESE